MKFELNYKMFLQCKATYDCRTLTSKTAHKHVCEAGRCVLEDKRRKRDITAQLIPAPGDGEIVPLVCEGDHCVAKDMSPSTDEPMIYQEERVEPAYVVPSIDEPWIYE